MELNKDNEIIIPTYRRLKDICVDVYSHEVTIEKRFMCGKMFLNSEKGEVMFTQTQRKSVRSKEIGRTLHSRNIRRPDGTYQVTFRCNGNEKNLKNLLMAEVREIAIMIEEDRRRDIK